MMEGAEDTQGNSVTSMMMNSLAVLVVWVESGVRFIIWQLSRKELETTIIIFCFPFLVGSRSSVISLSSPTSESSDPLVYSPALETQRSQ